jgi:hypothetical protein
MCNIRGWEHYHETFKRFDHHLFELRGEFVCLGQDCEYHQVAPVGGFAALSCQWWPTATCKALVAVMAWFSRTGAAARLEARLRDFRYMSAEPVGHMYPTFGWAKSPKQIVITVVNRVSHLTLRMERVPHDWTASASRWYANHLDLIPLIPEHRVLVDEMVARLMVLVHAYETRVGYTVDPAHFGRIAGGSDATKTLYGRVIAGTCTDGPSFSSPAGQCAAVISQYCWKSGFDF